MIPKNIFQTFELEYEDLPELGIQTTSTWKDMNPGWNYVYMGAEERRQYVKDTMPEIIKIYDFATNMYKSDIWRYLIVFNLGGVYSDLDSICARPLDHMLEQYKDQDMMCESPCIEIPLASRIENRRYVVRNSQHVNNANFGAVKESTILKLNIDKMYKLCSVFESTYEKDRGSHKEEWDYLKDLFYNTINNNVFSEHVLTNKDLVLFIDRIGEHRLEYKFWNNEDLFDMWKLKF